jgi:hypothetical protein
MYKDVKLLIHMSPWLDEEVWKNVQAGNSSTQNQKLSS